MKVLAGIITPPHLAVSGAVQAAKALSRAVAEHCDIDVALMGLCERETRIGAARLLERRSTNFLAFTSPVLPDRARTLFYRSDIPTLARDGGYDLVHLHNPIPALELRRVSRACRRREIPYVISTHGLVEVASGGTAYGVNRFTGLLWRTCVDRPFHEVITGATMVFALSPADLPILTDLGVRPDRVEIVSNGVDVERYGKCTDAQIDRICSKFDLPPDKDPDVPVCFFLANHTANKGIDILLEAYSRVDRPFRLLVGGRRKTQNVDYARYASREQRRSVLFTDSLTDEEALAFFHYADLFVFPTRADTFPLVILEAMASGTPTLATRVGGIPFQVDSSCGLLVEPENPAALIEGYRYLYERRERLREMGRIAQGKARSQFSWTVRGEEAFRLYDRILARTG